MYGKLIQPNKNPKTPKKKDNGCKSYVQKNKY